ncbi:c-type cytochrome [Azospirillum melinis]
MNTKSLSLESQAVRTFALAAATALATIGIAAFCATAWAETPQERGKYLMNAVIGCGNCHTTLDDKNVPVPGMELAGRDRKLPEGTYFNNPNLTPDPETGIGRWTDEQIMDVIRYGRRPNGELITSRMPIEVFRRISDNDLKAIVAYLRSIPPVKHLVHRTNSRLDTPPPAGGYGPPISVPDVPRSDMVAYGEYLAHVAHCMECHTPGLPGQKDYEHRLGAGGAEFVRWQTGEVYNVSRNITPHPRDGIGAWTDQEIKDAIRKGIEPGGYQLRFPMAFAYYQNMSDDDADALVAYLRSIPPQEGFGAKH